eukprot:8784788-Prorocentrum_lima.AAC.1
MLVRWSRCGCPGRERGWGNPWAIKGFCLWGHRPAPGGGVLGSVPDHRAVGLVGRTWVRWSWGRGD